MRPTLLERQEELHQRQDQAVALVARVHLPSLPLGVLLVLVPLVEAEEQALDEAGEELGAAGHLDDFHHGLGGLAAVQLRLRHRLAGVVRVFRRQPISQRQGGFAHFECLSVEPEEVERLVDQVADPVVLLPIVRPLQHAVHRRGSASVGWVRQQNIPEYLDSPLSNALALVDHPFQQRSVERRGDVRRLQDVVPHEAHGRLPHRDGPVVEAARHVLPHGRLRHQRRVDVHDL
mmetsp:Transcript_14704/g.32006  ORF Transcript_14704/g.32006 Transcript_14704/m.32006 type:complete len:233 (-) Transcript_14704:2468-3166(-)